MSRVSPILREALTTTVHGRVVVLDPIAGRVTVQRGDGRTSTEHIDSHGRFILPVFIDGEDRSIDVMRALGACFGRAHRALAQCRAAGALARFRLGPEVAAAQAESNGALRDYERGLRALEHWRHLGAPEAAREEVSQ